MSTPAAEPKEEQQVATAGQAVAEKPAQRRRSRVYTVRRGDTLWEIAESYFGGGWRYRAIVKQNKRQIKDPHWIYPEQQFRMPGG
jgi:nucleoid-associated protein YgaU